MIYRNVPLTDWIEMHPDLEVIEGLCSNCSKPMPTTQPFETVSTVGLESLSCGCGKNKFKAIISIDKDFR